MSHPRSRGGAISLIMRDVATEMGSATMIAIAAMTTEPSKSPRIPGWTGADQVVPVKNRSLKCLRAHQP